MSDTIIKSTWRERALYLICRRKVFLVEGDSMLPSLAPGDKVLVDPRGYITVGDVVLAEHPYRSDIKIIKRVADVADNGRLTLSGDNPTESTDSRTFGTVSLESIIGKVTSKLK
ncbi:MAG: nickel-type superoxide dismutase maturation protease [Pyrinomonadaceae bacterium]